MRYVPATETSETNIRVCNTAVIALVWFTAKTTESSIQTSKGRELLTRAVRRDNSVSSDRRAFRECVRKGGVLIVLSQIPSKNSECLLIISRLRK